MTLMTAMTMNCRGFLNTAGCTDTDLPAGRRYFGQSDKPLIGTAHVYHAMWVMFTETRCRLCQQPTRRSGCARPGNSDADCPDNASRGTLHVDGIRRGGGSGDDLRIRLDPQPGGELGGRVDRGHRGLDGPLFGARSLRRATRPSVPGPRLAKGTPRPLRPPSAHSGQ